MKFSDISETWVRHLGLTNQPVAVGYSNAVPEDVKRSDQPAPSACTFWKRGQTELFYATAEDHTACPIGLMTMGFPLSEEQKEQAFALVGEMAKLHYFDPAEVAHVPTISKPHSVIVYGPLGRFPIEPDQVLLFLLPHQAMLASEAVGQVSWSDKTELGAFGRPACAALPKSEKADGATLSLGCIGARTYTDLPEGELLLVIPWSRFLEATDRLNQVMDANQKLASYHSERRRAVSAEGKT